MIKGKKIFISGGTGSLGNALVKHLLPQNPREIVIYSRGEHKQANMEKKFPECSYYLGDVRDLERLKMAMRGCDIVIHAAALKVVPKGERDPIEFVETNIGGAKNVILAAVYNDVKKVVAVSTDKACDPINLYGATKLCSDKMFQAANWYNKDGTPVFVGVRYGNIVGSTGSVVPLFLKQTREGKPLTITDPNMTRFLFTLPEACKFIQQTIETGKAGEILIPELKAMNIMDMAEICQKKVMLEKNDPRAIYDFPTKTIGIRPGEKMHEKLEGTNGCYYSNEVPQLTKEEFLCYLSEM